MTERCLRVLNVERYASDCVYSLFKSWPPKRSYRVENDKYTITQKKLCEIVMNQYDYYIWNLD